MRFVKFKGDKIDVTKVKEYKIEFETKSEVCIIDNAGDLRTISKSNTSLEIIDRPVMVKAYENFGFFRVGFELIHDLGSEFEQRYICKDKSGAINCWKNIEYIEEKLTLEQRIEKLEQLINNK